VAPGLETVNCRRVCCCAGVMTGVAFAFVVVFCPHVILTCDDCFGTAGTYGEQGRRLLVPASSSELRFRNVILALFLSILRRFTHVLTNRHNSSPRKIRSEKMVPVKHSVKQPGGGMRPRGSRGATRGHPFVALLLDDQSINLIKNACLADL
jgi:hypothetical protein